MEKKISIYTLCLLLGLSFVACDKDDDPAPEKYTEVTTGFCILNGGDQNENNAGIAYFDDNIELVDEDIYVSGNRGTRLGDSAEQMLVYGSKTYVTVTLSNRLVVLNKNGQLLKEIQFKDDKDLLNPRCMLADNGKVYVSYFYGHSVAELDTTSLEIKRKVNVGRYPEQLAIEKGKLFVANSGGLDWETGYNNTVSVIDLTSFEEERTIEVVVNPMSIESDNHGNIYVISMGNYYDIQNTLQKIDINTYEVEVLGNASRMAYFDNTLYLIHAQFGEEKQPVMKYDVVNKVFTTEDFIPTLPKLDYPTLFAVNPLSGDIYIGDSPVPAGTSGNLYIYNNKGTAIAESIDTGGSSPKSIVFYPNPNE